jgi:hypothetical protein
MDAFITNRSQLMWLGILSAVRETIGRALEALHLPASIREFEYVDKDNETVYLSTGARYSVLHVGDKRYFFNRLTGRLDGTCTSLQERVADGLELRD